VRSVTAPALGDRRPQRVWIPGSLPGTPRLTPAICPWVSP
jgi:hypothetical protein